MRLGFIVGRGNEVYRNDALKKKTPKKFLVDNLLHVDVAIAMTVKENYPGVDVDIILPKEITLQRFKKNDIKQIDSINKKLDPNFHQAMMEIEDDTKEPGTIIQEIQKGFTIKDRLLRPSLVGVAKKTEKKAAKTEETKENSETK